MTDLWRRYQQLKIPRPATNLTWPLSGVGLAHFGREGRPVAEPMPRCGPAEILVRVDAVGICSSDAKMIRLGAGYPLFYGRDLARQPARLGHEVALTVIEVGQRWQGHYRPGQRLGLQPDVFVQGQRRCFGVLLPGGFCQYLSLGAEVLAGDAGSYVFPVPDALAYADIALLEPWACVEAAYSPRRRLELHPNGLLWIKGWPGDDRPYSMSRPRPGGTVILSDVPESFAAWVRGQPVEWLSRDGAAGPALLAELGRPAFDDIILLNSPDARSVAAAAGHLAAQGTLTIVRDRPLDGPVPADVGRIHYEFIAFLGCPGPDISQAFGPARNRSELRPGGLTWIAGAGGPMGRMHLQRALQMANGPRTVIVTNRGQARLADLQVSFAPLAEAQGRHLIALNPQAEPERLAQVIAAHSGGRGCDDIVVIAPDVALMAEAARHLAADGMLALFAGVPLGNTVPLPLDQVARHGAQFTGTSGSSLADQQRVIARILAGDLAPARSVAAVGGLTAAAAGLQAVLERLYPGKVMLYPQLLDLPLLSLAELEHAAPPVYAKLGPNQSWTAQAEQALFEHFLARSA